MKTKINTRLEGTYRGIKERQSFNTTNNGKYKYSKLTKRKMKNLHLLGSFPNFFFFNSLRLRNPKLMKLIGSSFHGKIKK